MTDSTEQSLSPASTGQAVYRSLSVAVLILALGAGASLGIRTISSPDLGYHLAYGEEFLRTGRIVDSSPEIYTLDAEALARTSELPPGAWIDEQGVYRFPNANWASQVLFSFVHARGEMIALGVLQAGLVLGIFLVVTVSMLRLGLSPAWAALGVLLISLAAYERFMLRPELVGYLVLAVQFALLLPVWRNDAIFPWWRVAVLAGLQWLLVNLHSYWMLGLGLTLAGAGGEVIGHIFPVRDAANHRRGGRLFALLMLQAGVSFANPWTWRLAALPIQTLMYFSRHQISTADPRIGGHPWSIIGECFRPLESPFADIVATKAYIVLLVLVLPGLLCGTLKRRWGLVILQAGMAVMSLSMRRNIAPGAILLAPSALGCMVLSLKHVKIWNYLRAQSVSSFAAVLTLGVIAAGLIGAITTNRFYFEQRRPDRFGFGISLINTPVGAARWLNQTQPEGRLWTDHDSSSNVYFFTRFPDPNNPAKSSHPKVPILTNTWAYPPEIMREMLDVSRGMKSFTTLVEQYGLEIVVLRVGAVTTPLVVELTGDRDWALVYLDAMHTVWLRAEGINSSLVKKYAITRETFHLSAFAEQLRRQDPEAPSALHVAGVTLQRLGWFSHAIELLRNAVLESPRYSEAWLELGACHALRSQETRLAGMNRESLRLVMKDLLEAGECFRQCLLLDPRKEIRDQAAGYLQAVQRDYNVLDSRRR
ncbi:MAG: hypothetical protein JXA11_14355 [Phycisphaerae bacterium]|nr:hypothetical protein [Phycisphaerae bacterium]